MAKSIKTITIVSFSLVLAALLTAIISDIAIFSQQILTFIAAIFISAIVFLFAIVLMIVSIMLVFGVIILKNDGLCVFARPLQRSPGRGFERDFELWRTPFSEPGRCGAHRGLAPRIRLPERQADLRRWASVLHP